MNTYKEREFFPSLKGFRIAKKQVLSDSLNLHHHDHLRAIPAEFLHQARDLSPETKAFFMDLLVYLTQTAPYGHCAHILTEKFCAIDKPLFQKVTRLSYIYREELRTMALLLLRFTDALHGAVPAEKYLHQKIGRLFQYPNHESIRPYIDELLEAELLKRGMDGILYHAGLVSRHMMYQMNLLTDNAFTAYYRLPDIYADEEKYFHQL